jgi:peptidyl-tRNA hydrolase
MKQYMYIAVRKDLSRSQQVVQSAHAAIEASAQYHSEQQEHPSVIVLGVKNESKLHKFKDYVEENSLKYKLFREPDMDNELTAVAVFPVSEDQKKMFKKYQLLN